MTPTAPRVGFTPAQNSRGENYSETTVFSKIQNIDLSVSGKLMCYAFFGMPI
jgi:hypothetical protein